MACVTKLRETPTPYSARTALAGAAIALSLLAGCTSPPSAVPLLRFAERAMRAEAGRLRLDIDRDVEHLRQTRMALESAFEADLNDQDDLEANWVRDATRVYVAAREALVRHEQELEQERRLRAGNLLTAADAQQRAVSLLERQDQLIIHTIGLDIWNIENLAGATPATPYEERRQ